MILEPKIKDLGSLEPDVFSRELTKFEDMKTKEIFSIVRVEKGFLVNSHHGVRFIESLKELD